MGADENPLPGERGNEAQGLRFGPFEMDLRSGEMRRNGIPVHIQPQPFKVLEILVRRSGEVVTREELQSEVWPAGTFVDFEQSLNFCIRQIRSALGDQATAPRYVETLLRKGYRWIGGAVEVIPASGEVVAFPQTAVAKVVGSEAVMARPRRLMWTLGLLGLAGVLGVVVWSSFRGHQVRDASFQRITFRRGTVTAARFGPEGQVVYTAAWDGGSPSLHVARPDPRDTHTVDTKAGQLVAATGSGEVAYLEGATLYRVPLSDGPAKAILEGVMAADWSRDGTEFALVRPSAAGVKLELPAGTVVAEVERTSRVRISPDGRHVALTQHPMPFDDRGFVAVFDRQGKKIASTKAWASVDGLAWSADGSEVWFTAAAVGADSVLNALDLRGRVRTPLSSMGRLILHDVAPDGRVLLERSTLRAEMLFQRAQDATPRDLSWLDYSAAEGLSADGEMLLFFESGEGGGAGYMTFFRRTDGSLPVRLGPGRATSLSPDGRWALTIPLERADHVDMVPTGAGDPRRIEIPGAIHEWASWLGDGSGVLLRVQDPKTRARTLWRTQKDGSSPERLDVPVDGDGPGAVFHPDGSRYVIANGDHKDSSRKRAGPCPDRRPCIQGHGDAEPVRGSGEGWVPVAWDTKGQIWFQFRDKSVRPARISLYRLDPSAARAQLVCEMSPRDRAGILGLAHVVVAANGESWAFTALRRLSDLFVVTNVN